MELVSNNGGQDTSGSCEAEPRADQYLINVYTDHVKGPDETLWVRWTIAIGPQAVSLALPPDHMESLIKDLVLAMEEAVVKARTTPVTE